MTMDNGMDVSPSWQELKDERDRLLRNEEAWREAGHLQRVIAGAQAETMSEALDALEYMDREVGSDRGALDATRDELRERIRGYRRQAEGGDDGH